MLNLGKYVISFFLSIIILFYLASNIFASSVNANAGNANLPNSESSNFQNPVQGNNRTNLISNLDTNPDANIESLDQVDYSQSSVDYSNIINIILIAVGLVIILLAVAILVRLKR